MLEEILNFAPFSKRIACAGQPSEAQLAGIRAAGFEVVINLGLHSHPEVSLADEAGSVENLGMSYIHIPVVFEHPVRANLEDFFNAMDMHRGRKIFVHCAMNMRASTFLGLYALHRLKQPPAQAFALMRRIWKPDGIWQAFIDQIMADSGF